MTEPSNDVYRLPVSMSREENLLLTKIKHAIELREGKRLSNAEVVRIALRTQAAAEGILCQ